MNIPSNIHRIYVDFSRSICSFFLSFSLYANRFELKISFVNARHMANILWLLPGNDTQMNAGASVRNDVTSHWRFFSPATMTVRQLFQRGKRQFAGLFNTRRRFRIEIAFSSVQCKINAPMLLTIRTSGC